MSERSWGEEIFLTDRVIVKILYFDLQLVYECLDYAGGFNFDDKVLVNRNIVSEVYESRGSSNVVYVPWEDTSRQMERSKGERVGIWFEGRREETHWR